jgi:CDP-diglyceride synthetase
MTVSRWISLVCVFLFCVYALILQPATLVVRALTYMFFPLAAIWYGDKLGSYTGSWRTNEPTPGIMIKIAGWILLFLTPVVIYTAKIRLEIRN